MLRARLDAVDEQLHDLLMRRAEIVEGVARDGVLKTGAKIRPGREAKILRRLLARHAGSMPPQAVTRVWREIFAASLVIEGGQVIAVCDGEGGADRMALAREHFGPLTPVRRHHNPAQTLADVARDTAQLAVLPAPTQDDDAHGGWWEMLTGHGQHRLFVIAKLPFWSKRAEGSPQGVAFVVAGIPPDESGADRSMVALVLAADTSRTRVASLLTEAGFTPGQFWLRRMPGDSRIRALVEVDGVIEDEDPRLAAIAGLEGKPFVVGAYAMPYVEEA